MLDKIKSNYFEMVKKYDQKSKSDHWEQFFSKRNLNKLEKFDLSHFRKKNIWGYSHNQGMEDNFGFHETMISLIDLLNESGKEEVKNLIELDVGKPKQYSFGDIRANYHEIITIKQLNKINKYLNENHKVVCEIGGGFGSLASKLKKKIKIKILF